MGLFLIGSTECEYMMLDVNNFKAATFLTSLDRGGDVRRWNVKYALGNKHLYFQFIFFILCNHEDIPFCIVNTSHCQRWQLKKIACLLTKRSSGEAMIRALHKVHNNTPYNSQLTLVPRGLRKWQILQASKLLTNADISRPKEIKGSSALSQTWLLPCLPSLGSTEPSSPFLLTNPTTTGRPQIIICCI